MSELLENSIGILAAMDREVQLIKDALINPSTCKIAAVTFHYGKIGSNNVVVATTGEGKVSAAISAQVLVDKFNPREIINTGCAGAISPDLNIGDIVVSDKVVQWDINWGSLGHPRGHIFALEKSVLHADAPLVYSLCDAIKQDNKVVKGLVVTGDTFVDSVDLRQTILSSFPDALCTEMEGGAVGHVCAQNNVPFCVIRCISDSANNDSIVDFPTFSMQAGEKSAKMLISYLNS